MVFKKNNTNKEHNRLNLRDCGKVPINLYSDQNIATAMNNQNSDHNNNEDDDDDMFDRAEVPSHIPVDLPNL